MDSLSGFLYEGGTLWSTFDGGNSWQSQPTPLDTGAVFARDMSGVYIGGFNRIAHSTDLGQTWTYSSPIDSVFPYRVNQIQFLSDSIGFASTELAFGAISRIYRTTDGGATWQGSGRDFYSFLEFGSMRYADEFFHFVDANRGFMMDQGSNGDWVLIATVDGGFNWTQVMSTQVPIPEINFPSDSIGHWGLVASTADGGQNWSPTNLSNYPYSVGWLNLDRALVQTECLNPQPFQFLANWSQTFDGGQSLLPLTVTGYRSCYGKIQFIQEGLAYGGGVEPFIGHAVLARLEGGLTGRLEQTSEAPKLQVHPNPASEVLRFVMDGRGEMKAVLVDAMGQVVRVGRFKEGEGEFRVGELPGGVYFLRIHVESGIRSRSIVIQP